jgi:hypothetical protein
MNLTREEVELLIRGLDVLEDEFTGTTDFELAPIEALRAKLTASLHKGNANG